jgi:NAD(P)-dependent dehydrogenase (short-subunit alcohol dehydrogenase family)
MGAETVIIVTGASRGIGAAITGRLLQAQASVVAVARTVITGFSPPFDKHRPEEKLLPLAADVADPSACEQVVRQTIGTFGRLDALVNNAAILEPVARLAEADPTLWRKNLEVNLLGPFYLCRAAIPFLRQTRGRIVNISSGAAQKTIQGWSAYCVAKAALTHFTRQLATEEPTITAVALRPGVVDTAMQTLIRQQGPAVMPPDQSAYFQALKDRGELLDPAIPARAAAWLALSAPETLSGVFIGYDDPRIGAAISGDAEP